MIIWWCFCFVIVGAFAVVVVAPFCWLLLIYLYCLSALDGISNCNQPRWIQFGIVSFGASTGCGTGHPNGYLSSLSFYWIFSFVIFIFILYLPVCLDFRSHVYFWSKVVVLKIPRPPTFKHFCLGIRGLLSTLTSSEILWEPHTTSTKLYWFILFPPLTIYLDIMNCDLNNASYWEIYMSLLQATRKTKLLQRLVIFLFYYDHNLKHN